MRMGVVIDSACDLPDHYLRHYDIHILPTIIRLGNQLFIDARDPQATQTIYQQLANNPDKKPDTKIDPCSVEHIKALFLDELVLSYDRILLITIAQNRSQNYQNAVEASYVILKEYRERRQRAGISGSFQMAVLDSKTVFTGQGVLVHEAVRLLKEERPSLSTLRTLAEALATHIYTYLIPNNLSYTRYAGVGTNERSVSLLSYHVDNMLDMKPIFLNHYGANQIIAKERGFEKAVVKLFEITAEAVHRGLWTQVVNISYAGDPAVLENTALFQQFQDYVKSHGVDVLLSVMSTTAGLQIGPGALSLAYAAE